MARGLRLTWWTVAILAILSAAPGWSQEPQRADAFSVLVIPVFAPDPGLRPLATQVVAALEQGLRAQGRPGQSVLAFRRSDPTVQRALREHPYIELPVNERVSPALADALGWALRVDTTVSGVLEADNGTAALTLRASGVRSRTARRETWRALLSPELRAGSDPDAAARWARALLAPALMSLAAELPLLAAARPTAPEEHFREGERLSAQGDYALAIAEYDMASASSPEEAGYYLALSRTYRALGDLPAALLEVRRALRFQPDLLAARLLLGEICLAQGRLEPALQAFQEAAVADPRDPDALRGLARVYTAQGQYSMALVQYNRLLAVEPMDLETLLAAAGVAEQWGRWQEAADYYRAATALEPERPELRQRLVDLYRRQGDRAAAVAALKEAQDAGVRMTYDEVQFVSLARMMDAEAADIIAAARVQSEAGLQAIGDGGPVRDLRRRADNLALAAEGLTPPEPLLAGHLHRVLAFHQLNQSNYELVRYLETRQRERQTRARLLREAAEQTLARARELDADAGWPVVTAETTEQGAESPAP